MEIAKDWQHIWWLLLLVYGVYAPCLLTLLDNQLPLKQRVQHAWPSLIFSWVGYWWSLRQRQRKSL